MALTGEGSEVGVQLEKPHPGIVHLAIITTQLAFGIGAVVGKFGISGTNPVLFALIREGTAGPLLLIISYATTRVLLPESRDVARLIACGFMVFSNQFFMIVGLKLSDPVTASAWQPSQPIFTVIIAIAIGLEVASKRKVIGTCVAVAGAVFMVVWGQATEKSAPVVSQGFFFLNCLGTALYVILSKPLLTSGRYKAICVLSWSYMVASLMMLVTFFIFAFSPSLTAFLCQKNGSVDEVCVGNTWKVPSSMILPLLYWIIFNSIVAYFLMTWGNQYAKASVVMAYTVLQPLTSASACALLILIGGTAFGDKYGLQSPGIQDIGALGIALGLGILLSEKTMDENPRSEAPRQPMLDKPLTPAEA